jgi:hypothetical protein
MLQKIDLPLQLRKTTEDFMTGKFGTWHKALNDYRMKDGIHLDRPVNPVNTKCFMHAAKTTR